MFEKMLFVGLNTTDKNIIKKLIKEYHVGGVILYSKNYHNYQEMICLINQIHTWAEEEHYTLLIGIDEEGYRVNRLPKEFVNLKSPFAFRHDLNSITEHASIIAHILAKSTIHVNFAPVLDIKRFPDNHAIGDRCFGASASEVIQNTLPYIEEFKKKNVVPVIKHFPGHGATKTNSHYLIPVIWRTKRLFRDDIMPFSKAIERGIDALMVGHFIIPKFSFLRPTSISLKTVKYLRNNLNYSNIIMTDDLMMGPLKLANKAKLIKTAINNGINMVMIKYYDNLFFDIDKLRKCQTLNKTNITSSIQLIDNLIIKYHITNDLVSDSLNIDEINRRINKLNNSI